jgi:hypothetical protein
LLTHRHWAHDRFRTHDTTHCVHNKNHINDGTWVCRLSSIWLSDMMMSPTFFIRGLSLAKLYTSFPVGVTQVLQSEWSNICSHTWTNLTSPVICKWSKVYTGTPNLLINRGGWESKSLTHTVWSGGGGYLRRGKRIRDGFRVWWVSLWSWSYRCVIDIRIYT